MAFDVSRAVLQRPDWFERFRVNGDGFPLRDAKLEPETQLIVVQRGETRRAFLRYQLVYHHVAQGEWDGEPFVITF